MHMIALESILYILTMLLFFKNNRKKWGQVW